MPDQKGIVNQSIKDIWEFVINRWNVSNHQQSIRPVVESSNNLCQSVRIMQLSIGGTDTCFLNFRFWARLRGSRNRRQICQLAFSACSSYCHRSNVTCGNKNSFGLAMTPVITSCVLGLQLFVHIKFESREAPSNWRNPAFPARPCKRKIEKNQCCSEPHQ